MRLQMQFGPSNDAAMVFNLTSCTVHRSGLLQYTLLGLEVGFPSPGHRWMLVRTVIGLALGPKS